MVLSLAQALGPGILKLIELGKSVNSIWGLLGFVVAVGFVAFLVFLRTRGKVSNSVFFSLLAFLLLIILAGVGVVAAPLWLDPYEIRGVVVDSQTKAAIREVRVSIAGFPELKDSTDTDGNFKIVVSARDRRQSYKVRAQYGTRAVGTAEVNDGDKQSIEIQLQIVPQLPETTVPPVRGPATTDPEQLLLAEEIRFRLSQVRRALAAARQHAQTCLEQARQEGGTVPAPDVTQLFETSKIVTATVAMTGLNSPPRSEVGVGSFAYVAAQLPNGKSHQYKQFVEYDLAGLATRLAAKGGAARLDLEFKVEDLVNQLSPYPYREAAERWANQIQNESSQATDQRVSGFHELASDVAAWAREGERRLAYVTGHQLIRPAFK